jgi:hypothetical protein
VHLSFFFPFDCSMVRLELLLVTLPGLPMEWYSSNDGRYSLGVFCWIRPCSSLRYQQECD